MLTAALNEQETWRNQFCSEIMQFALYFIKIIQNVMLVLLQLLRGVKKKKSA